MLATITPLKILTYPFEVAQYAGELARDLDHPLDFADAAIAATAVVNNASLFTLNARHFKGIEGIELVGL